MAADEAKKRGELQAELVNEHKEHAETAERLVKETSQKIGLAKRLVNAEATSLVRFDASKELEDQLREGNELKKELSMKSKEVGFAKKVLHDIVEAPKPAPPMPESVTVKVTDPHEGKSASMTITNPKQDVPAMVKVVEQIVAKPAEEPKKDSVKKEHKPKEESAKEEKPKKEHKHAKESKKEEKHKHEKKADLAKKPQEPTEPEKVHEHQPAGANAPNPEMNLKHEAAEHAKTYGTEQPKTADAPSDKEEEKHSAATPAAEEH